MSTQVEHSRMFRRGGALGYLEAHDRHLTAAQDPQFSFGFIGCGMMGQEHIYNTLLLGRAKVGGLFDPAAKSIESASRLIAKRSQQQAPKVYASIEEACADRDTDALIIATPNYTHLEVMRAVAGCNKALFVEKPIATTVADAFEVCQLAAAHSRPVRFGLQYRYKSVYA
ncbi:MAG: Gfo/Idh/MocA family oxidoreductase, partial [Pseudomonadota bacterium]|nr:Gfo/Idh/MocA family oxidoreductase [Pseudomonadota bacterium]